MALGEDIERLSRLTIFQDLEPDALRLIAFSAESLTLGAGDVLFREGDISDGGFVVVSGSFSLSSGSEAGGGTSVRAGALLGELALVAETRRPATATAREPAVVAKISRKLFQRVLNEYPGSAARLRAKLSTGLEKITAELATTRFRESPRKR